MIGPERRQTPRTTMEKHTYINIEPNNGGIVLNVSSDGLCFHSFDPVKRNGTIRFWFSDHNQRIEGGAELAWMDETQKGGLRFTTLPPEAREQISHWISQPAMPLRSDAASTSSVPPPALSGLGATRPEAQTAPAGYAPHPTLSAESKAPAPLTGFSGGLATGLLVAALVAAGFLFHSYRSEFGELLIRMGERFAEKPQAPMQTVSPASPPAAPVPGTISSLPERTASRARQVGPAPAKTASPAQVVSPEPRRVSSEAAAPTVSRPEKLVLQPLAHPTKPQEKVEPAAAVGKSAFPPNFARDSATESPAATPAVSPEPPKISLPTTAAVPGPSSAPAKPIAVPQLAPASHATVQAEDARTEKPESTSEMYFEIGKFKDPLQAHDTTDKLTQLGFPATAVQKGHLWKNSYHVLVGPYRDEEKARVTHQDLVSRGFKAQPFERGSRSISFRSGLTVNGERAPVGDYTVSWESYVVDATVKLVHENSLVATAAGKWVKRDVRYAHDAYVYRRNMDGSKTLLEIQFEGMRQALVFGKS